MISGVNITNGAGGSGSALSPSVEVYVVVPLRTFLGSKEHLECLKKDLNAAEKITAQDYKRTKN